MTGEREVEVKSGEWRELKRGILLGRTGGERLKRL
jgi:hypothetical protein